MRMGKKIASRTCGPSHQIVVVVSLIPATELKSCEDWGLPWEDRRRMQTAGSGEPGATAAVSCGWRARPMGVWDAGNKYLRARVMAWAGPGLVVSGWATCCPFRRYFIWAKLTSPSPVSQVTPQHTSHVMCTWDNWMWWLQLSCKIWNLKGLCFAN